MFHIKNSTDTFNTEAEAPEKISSCLTDSVDSIMVWPTVTWLKGCSADMAVYEKKIFLQVCE